MKGNLKSAVEHYREAIRIRPEFARAHLDLGATLADAGDVAGALPHLQKAAGGPEPAVRQEATQILRELGKGR
jgi:Flp pilus assembly protein TadD